MPEPLTEYENLFQLIIVARDMGHPVPYETTQPLQVALLDIDDNEPVFLKPPVRKPPLKYFIMWLHVHRNHENVYLCVCVYCSVAACLTRS